MSPLRNISINTKHLLNSSHKITAAQNEDALSYHKVRGLYILAVIFAVTIISLIMIYLKKYYLAVFYFQIFCETIIVILPHSFFVNLPPIELEGKIKIYENWGKIKYNFQRDINVLNDWAILNKMRLHSEKCKIISINNFNQNLLQELRFYLYPCELDDTVLDYTNEGKVVLITTCKFTYKVHQDYNHHKNNCQKI